MRIKREIVNPYLPRPIFAWFPVCADVMGNGSDTLVWLETVIRTCVSIDRDGSPNYGYETIPRPPKPDPLDLPQDYY